MFCSERQLWYLNEQWRSGVAAQELTQLEQAYRQYEQRIQQMRERFRQEEV